MRRRPVKSVSDVIFKWLQVIGVLVCLVLSTLVSFRWVYFWKPELASTFQSQTKTTVASGSALGIAKKSPKTLELDYPVPIIGSEIVRGDPTKKEIALTFDDGPHADITPQLLAILKWYNVKATFFIVGMQADKYPELVKTEFLEGHTLGNHTYHHDSLMQYWASDLKLEIRTCTEAVKRHTGISPRFFRPPGGNVDEQVVKTAQQSGLRTVLWTTNTADYLSPGAKFIEKRAIGGAKKGAIILLHDGVQQTVDALPNIIETLRAQDYKFVAIDEMCPEGD